MVALTVSWSTSHPCVGESSGRVICVTQRQQQCQAGISHPAPPCSRLWPRESKQAEAARKTFTSCWKQIYPIFLPSPCAFPGSLEVGQVLCCATLPKLVLPSLLWLRRRKEAGGQTALQSSGLLGRCYGNSGAGCLLWALNVTSGPVFHSKIGIRFHEVFKKFTLVPAVTMSPFHPRKNGVIWVNVIMMFLAGIAQRKLFYYRMLPNKVNIDYRVKL